MKARIIKGLLFGVLIGVASFQIWDKAGFSRRSSGLEMLNIYECMEKQASIYGRNIVYVDDFRGYLEHCGATKKDIEEILR